MTHIGAKALGALVAALVLGAAVAVPSFAAEEGCTANQICFYNQVHFESKSVISDNCSASGALTTYQYRYSARNRCGNKTNWLRNNGTVVVCMNPGGNRPTPGAFNEIYIAAEYGAFC